MLETAVNSLDTEILITKKEVVELREEERLASKEAEEKDAALGAIKIEVEKLYFYKDSMEGEGSDLQWLLKSMAAYLAQKEEEKAALERKNREE